MERLLRSKDVEGHQASTVNESFTHPRLHIPIPKRINSCKLFLDIPCTQVLGTGMVHNTRDAMLHNAQFPSNHVRVSIDIVIDEHSATSPPREEHASRKTTMVKSKQKENKQRYLYDNLISQSQKKTPCQTNDKDCGYYVMNLMKENFGVILDDSRMNERFSPKRETQRFYKDYPWDSYLSEGVVAQAREI
ncbi:hypothetical protein Lal_00031455 [Lupinus albus]|nr:hypothetical protein Lal_00031455 [Lupinus albus]